jgi:hypothetical protein
LSRSAAFAGDGINSDIVVPADALVGYFWSAPLMIGHPHGAGGPLRLRVRTATFNGADFFSPVGGRLTEYLIAGSALASIGGSHNGSTGDIPPQFIPNSSSVLGLFWAAQYTVVGGGFADLSQAVYGIVDDCP